MPAKAKPPPPPQRPVYNNDDPDLEGEEEEGENFERDEEVQEEEESEEEPPPNKFKGGVKAKGKPKPKPKQKATTTAKGKPKPKPKPTATTKVIKKASGPGAKPGPKPGAKSAPASPDATRKPSVTFKDAMQLYQNSPTRKLQKVKAEQAASEEEAAMNMDPQAIQRKMWNRFDRSLQEATQRQSRAPKAPARIRDAIMSAPDGGTRIDFFKLYCECGGDWGKVEAKHKKRESTRDGHGSRRRWLMLSQMAKLYESMEVALAMKALCMAEDGAHREHPKLKQEIAHQFLVEVQDDVWFEKFHEDEQTYTATGTLDMPSASRIAHGAESGAAPPPRVAAAGADAAAGIEDGERGGAEGAADAAAAIEDGERGGAAGAGEAAAVQEARGKPKAGNRMHVDPTLAARKAAAAKAKAKAKVKQENPLAAMKAWLKNVQEDLSNMKKTHREASAPESLNCGIPSGAALEFATYMQGAIPEFVSARTQLQEVVDGDKPIHELTAEWWQTLQTQVKEAHDKLNGWKVLVTGYKNAKKSAEKAKAKSMPAVPVMMPPPPQAPAALALPAPPPPPAPAAAEAAAEAGNPDA